MAKVSNDELERTAKKLVVVQLRSNQKEAENDLMSIYGITRGRAKRIVRERLKVMFVEKSERYLSR